MFFVAPRQMRLDVAVRLLQRIACNGGLAREHFVLDVVRVAHHAHAGRHPITPEQNGGEVDRVEPAVRDGAVDRALDGTEI